MTDEQNQIEESINKSQTDISMSKAQQQPQQRVSQAQIKLELVQVNSKLNMFRSSFGVNKPHYVNDEIDHTEMQSVTLIHMLKLPNLTSAKSNNPLIQIATVTGKQVCVRNLTNTQDNDPQFLPFTEPIKRITSMCSQAEKEQSVMAVAAMEYDPRDNMIIEIFDTSQKKQSIQIRPVSISMNIDTIKSDKKQGEPDAKEEKSGKDRQRIDLIGTRLKVHLPSKEEEKKKEGKECEFHSKPKSSLMKSLKNQIDKEVHKHDHPQSYISKMCFSNDLTFLAVLVSGGRNGIVVFKWQVKTQPYIEKWFDIPEQKSYKAGPQFCTGITFNPIRHNMLIFSGPSGLLSYYEMIQLPGGNKFEEPESVMSKGEIPKTAEITGQIWHEDGNFVACCTSQGHIVVYGLVKQILIFKHQYANTKFVQIEMNQSGLILASDKGQFYFFSLTSQDSGRNYAIQLICKWTPQTKISKLDDMSKLFYEFSSVDMKKDIMMAIVLKNKNVLYANIGNQVFSSLHRNQNDLCQGPQKPAEPEYNLNIDFQILGNGFHSDEISSMSLCLQRPIIMTCSIKDQMIKIFNYKNNQCEMSINFTVLDQITKKIAVTPLQYAVLHPSGYMIGAAISEQIKLFHIMHQSPESIIESNNFDDQSLRLFATFDTPCKKIQQMAFSNGGSLLVSADEKNIYVMTTYNLELITTIPSPSTQIERICFNHTDTVMAVCSKDGFLQRFDMIKDFKKRADADIKRNFQYRSCTFVKDESDENKILVTGLDRDVGGAVRILNYQENVLLEAIYKEIKHSNNLEINDLCFVQTIHHKINNMVLVNNLGAVQVVEMPKEHSKNVAPALLQQILVHQSSRGGTIVKVSVDNKYVITAGSDGNIFVFKVKELLPNQKKQPEEDDPDKMLVGIDPQLGKVVLVNKSLMDDWRKKQEQLRQQMEEQSNQVESSLRGEKYEYEKKIAELEKEKHKELQDLNKKYEGLQMAEAEQKDENTQHMKKLEITHTQYKEELQELYEKKLQYEQEQLQLLVKDQKLMVKQFNDEIQQLTIYHEQAIETLLQEFKFHLQKVQERYEQSKRDADGLKMINEEKLNQQEEEQETEISQLKKTQAGETNNLRDVIIELTNDIETLKWQKNRLTKEIQAFNIKKEEENRQTTLLQHEFEEKQKTIQQLEETKKIVQKNLKKKEEQLYSQKFKIKDLQKTKQVLTHRTLEMKASLEPKEQQIEQLKGQLLDLEGLFEINQKSMQEVVQGVKEKNKLLEDYKTKLEKLQRQIRGKYQAKISKFQNKIQKIEQTKDNDQYVQGLMEIYDTFVKSEADKIQEQKRKDPETIEELDRQLKYMEKMAESLKTESDKNFSKAKQNLKKRTGENVTLIDELGNLRIEQKKRDEKLKALDMDLNSTALKIKKQEDEILKIQEETQKIKQSEPHSSKIEERLWQTKDMMEMEQEMNKRNMNKGKVVKGPMFKSKPQGIFKAKILEMISQLQENNQTILMQRLQISTLHDELVESIGAVDGLGLDIVPKMGGHSAMSNYDGYNRDGQMRVD